MPLYVYRCPKGHSTEVLRSVESRADPIHCEKCERQAELEIQTSVFDPRMGCDSGFPTAYDKWAKTHSRNAKDKQRG